MSLTSCYRLTLATAFLGLATQLTACVSVTTPELDARFGDAVRSAREAQVMNPAAAASKAAAPGLDGRAAVNTIDRYQESFKSPPPTFEILNIGGALSGQ